MKRFKHQGGKGPRLCFLSGTCKLQAERHGGAVPVKRHAGGAGTHTGHTHGYTRVHTGHAGAQGHTDHTDDLTTIQIHQDTTRTGTVLYRYSTGTGKRGHSVRS